MSYNSTIGGMGGRTALSSVTPTGLIMVISGTVNEEPFAWF